MACNRPDYLERTMKSLIRVHGERHESFPLYISQARSRLILAG